MTTMDNAGLRPSLKRSLPEVEERNRNKLLRTNGSFAILSRARFANGQLPTNASRIVATNNEFSFPIPKASALVDDEFDSDTDSSISELDSSSEDEGNAEAGPAAAAAKRAGITMKSMPRTTSVLTVSSSQSGRPPTSEQRMKLLMSAKLLSESAPSLGALVAKSKKATKTPVKPQPNEDFMTKPDEFLGDMLAKKGIVVKTVPAMNIQDYFIALSDEVVDGYDMDLVKKVREEDVDGLRKMWKSGRSMQVSNKFGDSVVHMACRRSSLTVLRFLLEEAKVSCKVCCDSGRTPLHDACWTSAPNFDVARMLLERCPDLLYITDKRGFTPLNYARNSHWAGWCKFLEKWPHEKLVANEIWES